MKFHYCLVALAIACGGDKDATSGATGDSTTDTTGVGTDCAPDGPFTGPLGITAYSVTCTGTDVTFDIETAGVTAGGWVFSQETGTAGGQWADNHTLESYEYDQTCGTFDKLHRTIAATGTDAGTLAQDVNSLFHCDTHYEVADKMTYAFAVDDSTGNQAACSVVGGDPAALIAQSGNNVGEPPVPDLSACVEGLAAR